jgi:hypothetical protein
MIAGTMKRPPGAAFLPITQSWRILILCYLLFYRILFPAVAAFYHSTSGDLLLARVVIQAVETALLALPLLAYRRDYGWLHPLLLPTILDLMKAAWKYPFHLFTPLAAPVVSFQLDGGGTAFSLALAPSELAETHLWYGLIHVAALLCYYLGYFHLRPWRTPILNFAKPRHPETTCMIAVVFCAALTSIYIVEKGGISSYLLAMRGGRVELFEGDGQFRTIAQFSLPIMLLWFSYATRPWRNPLFIGGLAVASTMVLAVSGSRSSVIVGLMSLVLLWWHRRGRVLIVPTAAFGVFGLLLFAMAGNFRSDYTSQDLNVDFETMSFAGQLEAASVEFEDRANSAGDLAAFAGALHGDLLYGRTYLGAAAFWVPRALWPQKPRSADAYNMWINFAGKTLDVPFDSGRTWGIPVNAVTEAFWNFHLPGVVVIFVLYGMFHRWLAEVRLRYHKEPAMLVFVIVVLVNFAGTSGSFSTAVRTCALLIGLCFAIGVLRPRASARMQLPMPMGTSAGTI